MQFTYGIGQNYKQAQEPHIPDKQAKGTMLTLWRPFGGFRSIFFFLDRLLLSLKAIHLLQDSHLSSWQSHTQTELSSILEKGDAPPILLLIYYSLEIKFSLSWQVSQPKFHAKERW